MSIRILAGDLTTFSGDAICNAANNAGLGGGGVDGAIHRAAGPDLLEACKALPVYPGLKGLGRGMEPTNQVRVPTGLVVPTPAFSLPCNWILHTAGPVWSGDPTDDLALQNCYLNPLRLALAMGLKSIAFPAISAGVYGCPQETCARIALQVANRRWSAPHSIDVTFYIFPELPNLAIWQEVASNLGIAVKD